MVDKSYLHTLLKREKEYCEGLTVGEEEYVKCTERIMEYEKQLAQYEIDEDELDLKKNQVEESKKYHKGDRILEWTKVGANIALPLIGYVAIIAAEKEITFTGALRDVTKCFLPKKMQ